MSQRVQLWCYQGSSVRFSCNCGGMWFTPMQPTMYKCDKCGQGFHADKSLEVNLVDSTADKK